MVPAPERFGPVQSSAELRVARLLSEVDLGEPATCFYSVHLPRHEYKRMSEIDFLIAVEGLLLVVEVKGGRVARRDGLWTFTDRYGDIHEKREGPFDQVRTASFALDGLLRQRAPKLRTDFGWVVVTPDQALDRDLEWDRAEHIGPERMTVSALGSALKSTVRHWRSMCRHQSHSSLSEVLSILRPDFDRIPRLSLLSGALEQDFIRLASEQYEALRGSEINRRIFVTGGAGSGKTLLAIETARRAADLGAMVLLTCRSSGVIELMRSSLKGTTVNCVPYSQTAGLAPADVLVVDEAQDLMTVVDYLRLDALVIDGIEKGRWRMFSDPNNQLSIDGDYDPVVAEELCRNAAQYHLSFNCRNTAPVVQQTQLITGADIGVAKAGEGPVVVFKEFSTDDDAANLIDAQLKRLRQEDVALSDIAIVTLRDDAEDSAALLTKAFRRGQIDVSATACLGTEAAVLRTARQMKGLEAAHVLVIDVDDLSSRGQIARLYVGMTRPRVSLWLCVSSLAWSQMQAGSAEGQETR